MYYECEHGKKVAPSIDGPEALEACAECPTNRRHVKYRPVYTEDESRTGETQLNAAMRYHLRNTPGFADALLGGKLTRDE